jgi:hypothetical protein
LLDGYVHNTALTTLGDEIEGQLRNRAGKMGLTPVTTGETMIGSVPVPKKVRALCQTMRDIGRFAAKACRRMAVRPSLERVAVVIFVVTFQPKTA